MKVNRFAGKKPPDEKIGVDFSHQDVVQMDHHFNIIFLDMFMPGCASLVGGQAFISIGQLLEEKVWMKFTGHRAGQSLRRDWFQPDRAIAKTLIARAIENKGVRPTWYFYEKPCKEVMDVLK